MRNNSQLLDSKKSSVFGEKKCKRVSEIHVSREALRTRVTLGGT